jgi:hypothetical protein
VKNLYGTLAMYATTEQLTKALRQLRAAGYTQLEVYLPYPDEAIDELLPSKPTPIGWIILVAGLIGGGAAYFMQWYAAHDYALNVGGRPLHSWPSFVPITFELTVLTAAVTGLAALLMLSLLPRLDHPLYNSPRFLRASQDRFFLCVLAQEPHHAEPRTLQILADGAESVEEVSP